MSYDECPRCNRPYRFYTPWYEPPENHYKECRKCGDKEYFNEPDQEVEA